MDKSNIYQQLEEKFVKYKDLINIPVQEDGSSFTVLPKDISGEYGVIGKYESIGDMKENFPFIPVRKDVYRRLNEVDKALKKINCDLQLVVAYGYRSLEIQQHYFDLKKKEYLNAQPDYDEDVDEVIHRLIAVPKVAGHPTGGAVDVYIEKRKSTTPLDFGIPIFTFDSKDVYSFSPFISKEAQENRMLLRNVMQSQNFAPYDGEWWHFSFGDKEWAFYYKKSFANFNQKTSEEMVSTLQL